MISQQLRNLCLLVLISGTLWTAGESCTVGAFTPNLDTCNQYYLCVNSGGATMNIPLACKEGQNFDPTRSVCSASYQCVTCD